MPRNIMGANILERRWMETDSCSRGLLQELQHCCIVPSATTVLIIVVYIHISIRLFCTG
jgi:hypothetical protein